MQLKAFRWKVEELKQLKVSYAWIYYSAFKSLKKEILILYHFWGHKNYMQSDLLN